MTQHTSLPCMLHLVNAAVHIDRALVCRKCLIEIGLFDVCAETIDGFQSRGAINAEVIRAQAYDRAVDSVTAVVFEMARAPVGIISKINVSDSGEARTGISSERMQRQSVDYDGGYLGMGYLGVQRQWVGDIRRGRKCRRATR